MKLGHEEIVKREAAEHETLKLDRLDRTLEYNLQITVANLLTVKTFRMENKINAGTPDIHFITSNKHTGWIELKYAKTPMTQVSFRAGQPIWLKNYNELGGCAFILVMTEDKRIYMYEGHQARSLDGNKLHSIPPYAVFDTTRLGLSALDKMITRYAELTYQFVSPAS